MIELTAFTWYNHMDNYYIIISGGPDARRSHKMCRALHNTESLLVITLMDRVRSINTVSGQVVLDDVLYNIIIPRIYTDHMSTQYLHESFIKIYSDIVPILCDVFKYTSVYCLSLSPCVCPGTGPWLCNIARPRYVGPRRQTLYPHFDAFFYRLA